MRKRELIAVTIFALASSTGQAEQFTIGDVKIDIPVSQAYRACFDKAVGDLDMTVCSNNEAGLWDRRLNSAYAKLRMRLPKNDFSALQAFQRLWIADQEATCRDNGESGTAGRVNAASCYLRLTAVRTAELEMRAEAAGGN